MRNRPTTEGEAFDELCAVIGRICDNWQHGKITDQAYQQMMAIAARAWLSDQKRNTPK